MTEGCGRRKKQEKMKLRSTESDGQVRVGVLVTKKRTVPLKTLHAAEKRWQVGGQNGSSKRGVVGAN